MQLSAQLPFGIFCILFTHCARVTAVCSAPCDEIAPVYGLAPLASITGGGQSPAGDAPISSTAPPLVNPPATSTPPVVIQPPPSSTSTPANPPATSTPPVVIQPPPSSTSTPANPPATSTPPVAIQLTSSTSTPVPPSTTASSATPTSTPSLISSASTPTSVLSADPLGIFGPSTYTGVPTTTPLSVTASSSAVTPVIQSSTTSNFSFAKSNSSASATVPASITQCGSCRVLAEQVQVYFWPTASVKNNCARGASVNPFQTGVPYASNASNIQSLAPQVNGSPTTTVVEGYTL